MKMFLLTLTLLTASLAALAQGKIRFANDSLHLVYITGDLHLLLSGDQELVGVPYAGQTLANGVTLVADLYAGTSSSSLMSVATASFGPYTPGAWAVQNLTLPWAGGATIYFQVRIRESGAPRDYWGESSIFTTVLGDSITYPSIVQSSAPAYSTWAVGSYPMDSVAPGARGAIMIAIIPEPSVLALAGLGWVLLVCRRVKTQSS